MPVMVIADRIGWTRSIRMLSARVAELGPVCWPPDPASRMSYVAREIAQCDLWFPPIGLPVGFGQVRKPTQLPVLTMVTGYARWLLALLIPSRRVEDLFCRLVATLTERVAEVERARAADSSNSSRPPSWDPVGNEASEEAFVAGHVGPGHSGRGADRLGRSGCVLVAPTTTTHPDRRRAIRTRRGSRIADVSLSSRAVRRPPVVRP